MLNKKEYLTETEMHEFIIETLLVKNNNEKINVQEIYTDICNQGYLVNYTNEVKKEFEQYLWEMELYVLQDFETVGEILEFLQNK